MRGGWMFMGRFLISSPSPAGGGWRAQRAGWGRAARSTIPRGTSPPRRSLTRAATLPLQGRVKSIHAVADGDRPASSLDGLLGQRGVADLLDRRLLVLLDVAV